MRSIKRPRLPINRVRVMTGRDGNLFIVEVSIDQTNDLDKYPPDGVKAVFRILESNDKDGSKVLVVLIDNHRPLGYHEHDKLPGQHDSRKKIDAESWQDAWEIFAKKEKELI